MILSLFFFFSAFAIYDPPAGPKEWIPSAAFNNTRFSFANIVKYGGLSYIVFVP